MFADYQITITFNGGVHTFPVEVERKKRKQLILRVYPKTQKVLLSLPTNTPEDYARQFLHARRGWLEEQLLNMLALPPGHEYKDGETFYHMGRPIILATRPGASNKAELTDGRLILNYREPLDKQACRAALERLFAKLAQSAVEQSMTKMLPIYVPLAAISQPPAVKLRKMTSRWGVCWPRRRQLCFSTRLAHVAPELVDYVVAHELCHLRFYDHSPRFWQLLEQGLPDWRRCRKALSNINTAIDI